MGRRSPFDFNKRVELAKIYLDDGAMFTAAERLEVLARDIRKAAEERIALFTSGPPTLSAHSLEGEK